jgi:hypothetical protein
VRKRQHGNLHDPGVRFAGQPEHSGRFEPM